MRRLCSTVALLLVFGFAVVRADLVYIGPIAVSGTGLGAASTILTIQRVGAPSGCVGWNGTTDVVGAAACPPGIVGGDEKTGVSQTQTRSIASLGLTNAASLRIVLNAAEPGANSVTVNQVVVRIYDASTGAVLFSGPLTAPVFLPTTEPGVGNAGFAFQLNPAQAAGAQPAFGNTANRIGVSAGMSGTQGGVETFHVVNVVTPVPTLPQVVLFLLAVGLVAAGYYRLASRTRSNSAMA